MLKSLVVMIGSNNIIFCFEDFYPSNVPYCHILKDLIEECSSRGHKVKVITSFKSNAEENELMLQFFHENNMEYKLFHSLNSKRYNNIVFPIRIFFHLLFHGKGTVVVPSTPPVIMAFSVFLAKYLGFLRFDYIYHCQDIHPEALDISNNIKNQLVIKILKGFDKLSVKFSKKNIVLSGDMKKTLNQRYTEPLSSIFIHNNFIPSAYLNKSISKGNKKSIRDNHSKDDILFVFAGNIGAFQNLEMLLQGFLRLSINYNTYLYFIGDGKIKNNLIMIIDSTQSKMKENIYFLDSMKSNEIARFISNANYGVVSLSDRLLDVAFPSKISTYLTLGLPLLLCGGKNSEIDKEINTNNLGVSIDAKNIELITDGFVEAINRNEFFNNKHKEINRYFMKKYDREKLISNLIEEIVE